MNPEFFGDVPRDVRGQPGFGSFGDANVRLPGVPEGEYEGSYSRDVFAKTEKWLSPAPFFFGQCCARCNNSGSHGVMLN